MSIDWTALRLSLLASTPRSPFPPTFKLPILPHAVTEFTQKANSTGAGPAELGRILERDAGLTCDLLKYVNSAAVGLRRKVTSVPQVLSLLGIRTVRLYVVTSAIKHVMSSANSKLMNSRAFWNANLERALFAREVAGLLRVDSDVAFAASMLHDFLLPLLTTEWLDDYVRYCGRQESAPIQLDRFERQLWTWDHALAAAQVMYDWEFPDELLCCVAVHHQGIAALQDERLGTTPAAAVAVAALIPDPFRQVPDGLDLLLRLGSVWSEFDLLEIAGRVESAFLEEAPAAGYRQSLRQVCEKRLAKTTG